MWVLEDARNRVRNGIAHIAAAAIYLLELRTTPTTKILEVLERSQLKYRIISEAGAGESWFEGTPASLMAALRRVQEALVEDDIVNQTAKSLSVRLEAVAKLWMGQAGACDRLSGILGITQEELYNPGREVSINPKENSISDASAPRPRASRSLGVFIPYDHMKVRYEIHTL